MSTPMTSNEAEMQLINHEFFFIHISFFLLSPSVYSRYPSMIAVVWGIHFLFHQRVAIKQRLRQHVHAVIYHESGPHFIFLSTAGS